MSTSAKLRFLIVDDDPIFLIALSEKLSHEGKVTSASSVAEAQHHLNRSNFDMAFIDLNLGHDTSGLDVLKNAALKNIYTVILSGYTDDPTAEKAYSLGCNDYYVKTNELKGVLQSVNQFKMSTLQLARFEDLISNTYITQDAETKNELQNLFTRNLHDKSVMLLGPTGVGKTVLARYVHDLTCGPEKPFIEVNCGAFQETLLEAEFFGHEKGAFTGAETRKKGKLEEADGGTLFLDEIGIMPYNLQTKLLKALDEKKFMPVGSNRPIKSQFQIISATCDDLAQLLHSHKFRRDLYARLNQIQLKLKGLNQRRCDIALLLDRRFKVNGKKRMILKPAARESLIAYDWPGNVRELEHVVENLCDLGMGIIDWKHLPKQIRENRPDYGGSSEHQPLILPQHIHFIKKNGLKVLLDNMRDEAMKFFMEENDLDITKTLDHLKIKRSTYYKYLGKNLNDDQNQYH